MKFIAKNFKGITGKVIAGPLFKLFEAVLELLVPLVMADMIDVGVKNSDIGYILRGGLWLLLLAAGGVASAMVCQYFAAVAGGQFGRSLRMQVYKHVMRLSGDEAAVLGAGGLVTRITNDTNHIQTGVNMFIRLGTRAPFLVIGGIVMALIVNVKIGLIFLIATPLVGLVLYGVMRCTLPSYGKVQDKQDDLARLAGENLAGARVIRAFSRQQNEEADFRLASDDLYTLTVRVGKISAILNPLTSLIVNMAIVGIVWLGGRLAFSGYSAPGEVIAMVSYMNQILLAMVAGANLIVLFTRAAASTKRVAALLAIEPDIVDGPGAQEDETAPVISFQNVTFHYHTAAEAVLEKISFAIFKGQTIGIIGGTGSGKSTLVNLMLRYYDLNNPNTEAGGSGQVQVCGANVKDYPLITLRKKFGLVPQKTALFSGSVRRNLLLGTANADDHALWQALEAAQAADFVQKMSGGLDAEIREGGKNLSGGQRQRLCIARALVRKPDVLLLDDAASALDYATDVALRKALKEETKKNGMTVVLISQRAASLMDADCIFVLDDGRLAASGTHAELLATSTIYHEICASQGLINSEAI